MSLLMSVLKKKVVCALPEPQRHRFSITVEGFNMFNALCTFRNYMQVHGGVHSCVIHMLHAARNAPYGEATWHLRLPGLSAHAPGQRVRVLHLVAVLAHSGLASGCNLL